MQFDLDEEYELWRETIRRFVEKEIPRDYVRKVDIEHRPPWEAWKKIAAQGWLGLFCPEEYGGLGGDIFHVAVLLEELGRRNHDLAVMAFRTILHCNMKFAWHGTEEQRQFFLPRAIRGEITFALGVSEPDTGNDVSSLRTKAREEDDCWILNGHKMWTTGFQVADYCVVLARTDPNAAKPYQGLTNFMVDAHSPGITFREIPTLGRWPIPPCEVWYDDVKIPKNRVVGRVNEGWADAMTHLSAERFCSMAIFLGESEQAFEDALEYSKNRRQFGQPIGKFQVNAHKLADMRIQLDAARLLLYRAGVSINKGKPDRMHTAVMKAFVADTAKKVALDGLQIMGGFGYSMEMDMQRYVRDALMAPIGPGSNEIQRNIIARQLGL